jgi:hypothetical protein
MIHVRDGFPEFRARIDGFEGFDSNHMKFRGKKIGIIKLNLINDTVL